MNDQEKLERVVDKYDDISRLETILKLHKEGHIDTDQATNLIRGDRRYMMEAETMRAWKAQREAYTPNPYHNIYGGWQSSTGDNVIYRHSGSTATTAATTIPSTFTYTNYYSDPSSAYGQLGPIGPIGENEINGG